MIGPSNSLKSRGVSNVCRVQFWTRQTFIGKQYILVLGLLLFVFFLVSGLFIQNQQASPTTH